MDKVYCEVCGKQNDDSSNISLIVYCDNCKNTRIHKSLVSVIMEMKERISSLEQVVRTLQKSNVNS
jgi:hypothetical protein